MILLKKIILLLLFIILPLTACFQPYVTTSDDPNRNPEKALKNLNDEFGLNIEGEEKYYLGQYDFGDGCNYYAYSITEECKNELLTLLNFENNIGLEEMFFIRVDFLLEQTGIKTLESNLPDMTKNIVATAVLEGNQCQEVSTQDEVRGHNAIILLLDTECNMLYITWWY